MSVLAGLRLVLYEGVDMRLVWRRWWAARRRTLGLTFGAGALAVAVSFVMPRWYQAGAALVVDTGQQMSLGGGGVLGLAAQLGFGAGLGPTSPLFYESLLKSRSLREHVTGAKYPLGKNGELLSLEQYWSHHESPTARDHLRAVKRLDAHFRTSSSPRTSQVEFKLEGPSKAVAKLMADTALAALNDLVVLIRRKHATAEREFLEGRWHALADSLKTREDVLRGFYERNHNLTSPELQFEETRLRREVDRVQLVYAQLGSQVEQARIQEVRDTPALTVVDPPIEPVRKSAPSGRLWGLTAAILGALLALLLAMGETANSQMQALRLRPGAVRRTEQA
jgi:uncharacterized protein involved in exopolysaccharide biosynthesis